MDKKIILKTKSNETKEYNIICTFRFNNKNYIVYGNNKLYIASIINNNINKITNIEEKESVKKEVQRLLPLLNYELVGV